MKKLFSIFLCMLATALAFSQAVIDNDILSKVRDAVFEVVVDKYDDTTITYESELPMERIAFSIRNDKYTPLGTAFLLEDGTFLSASHVINLFGDSIIKDYYIRDSEGKTYKIDKITTLSNRRDYISFTVPDYKQKKDQGLTVNEDFQLNTNIFSVGNALGEGIIIRNGLLTSQTYENQNGDWQWLRFSAAASPGNSGGPLINEKGEVIGIITMKSENENLNYALPIAEIKKDKENTGIIQTNFYYRLPNIINKKQYADFNYEIQLPKQYNDLHAELTAAYKQFIIDTVNVMKKDYGLEGKKSFSKSKDKDEILFYSYTSNFPYTVYYNDSGNWDFGNNNTKNYQLDDNGSIDYCSMMGYVVANITKPDSISLEEFVSSPKIYMDYLLEAYQLHRTVANEQITITSFGEPSRSEKYTDYFGRTWLVNYFDINFADGILLSYALPTPTGVYVMYVLDSKSDVTSSHYLDMQFAADYFYSDLYGKIRNWKEYIALPESITGPRPDYEKVYKMEQTKDNFMFDLGVLQLNLSSDVFQIDDETKLDVVLGYNVADDGKVSLENRGMLIYTSQKEDGYRYLNIRKFKEPGKRALQKTKQTWNQFVKSVAPFDGEPYNNEQFTYKDCVKIPEGQDKENPKELFVIYTELKNQNQFDEINDFTSKAVENVIFR